MRWLQSPGRWSETLRRRSESVPPSRFSSTELTEVRLSPGLGQRGTFKIPEIGPVASYGESFRGTV